MIQKIFENFFLAQTILNGPIRKVIMVKVKFEDLRRYQVLLARHLSIFRKFFQNLFLANSVSLKLWPSRQTLQFSTLVELYLELLVGWLVSWLVGWLVGKKLQKTALTIFLKLGTMLDIDKLRKVTKPDFPKKSRFIHKV